jgi:hypothetical protein
VAVGDGQHRRNIVTRGVDLRSLAGRRFRIGQAVFRYDRPRPPCRYIQSVSEPGMTRALTARRGGICAQVVQGGEVRLGDAVTVVEDAAGGPSVTAPAASSGGRRSPGLRVAARAAAGVALIGAALLWREELSSLVPRTPRGWLSVGAVVAGVVLVTRVLLPRLVKRVALRRIVTLAVVAGVVWYAVVPAFRDQRFEEPLLGAASPAPVPAERGAPAPAPAAPADQAPAPSPGPERLAAGPLDGIGHRATGTAALYRLADGTHFVRLEDIDVQGAPDVFVHLVPAGAQDDPDGGTDLGRLKGNRGSQNYVVPDGIDTARHHGVLLWCRMFSTPIAAAALG